MLGNLCLRRLPVPQTIALAVGAAAESTIVFLLLMTGAANLVTFGLVGAICLGLFVWLRSTAPPLADPVKPQTSRVTLYIAGAALALYGLLYLINALAPELEPDAVTYHLGLTSEYLRLGGFPNRIGFFEMLPQGLEMLFVPAFAFGQHSAARLVHCVFLFATLPLLWRIGRRLQLPDGIALAAAALYFCAPVTGVTGTSAYTDAAEVFFVLATFYLLLVWRDTRDARYLLTAGVAAGFCYAVKIPGGLVVVLALFFVWATDRSAYPRKLAMLAGAALAVISPWLLRSLIMTGDPFAPLLNRLFPNPYFHLATERQLAAMLSSCKGVPPWRVPYELFVGGTFQGTLGMVFFALPLALLALRRPAGRLCWLIAVLLALPWFWNTGTRFLMPALPFLALCLVMALPRPAVWACIALQAVACWPAVMHLYHPVYTWRLERIPWRAALRIEPEQQYLSDFSSGYRIAQLVQNNTAPGARVFAFTSVATAYTDRNVVEFWHSAQADNLIDALRLASLPGQMVTEVTAEWRPRPVWGIRIRAPQPFPREWRIHDIQILSGEYRIFSSPQWRLRSHTNASELPLAFDGNPATIWRTWQPVRADTFVEADFDRSQQLTGSVVTSPVGFLPSPLEFSVRDQAGWHLVTSEPALAPKPLGDIRMAATRAVRTAGFGYILAWDSQDANGPLAAAMRAHPGEWGVEKIADLGPVLLFRIK